MSIEELYRKLDFLSKDGFVTLDDANWPNKVQLSPRIFSLIQDVSSPLHEMSALFAIGGRPLLFFFERPQDTTALFKAIWNLNEVPIVILVNDTHVDVFNGFKYEKELKTLQLIGNEKVLDQFTYFKLVTGKSWEEYRTRLAYHNRVDYYLLKNIEFAQLRIQKIGVSRNLANRLIGKMIFLRYLTDRHIVLRFEGVKKALTNDDLIELLQDKNRLSDLFETLQDKEKGFNGDLFKISREELVTIPDAALNVLIRLLRSDDLEDGSQALFDIYDFSILPVEFISNVYERFIGKENQEKEGAYYTPLFLAEYVVENTVARYLKTTTESGCRVLDPACGSGIFLVETLRRIINHYIAHAKKEDLQGTRFQEKLRELALNNIFGIDSDQSAVQVAAFSIYLTLLDYQKPADVSTFRFPNLLESNLLCQDAFCPVGFEDVKFDYIIGNPPWNRGRKEYDEAGVEIKPEYQKYIEIRARAERRRSIIGNKEIAQAFMVRALDFMGAETKTAFVLTSKVLYNNQSSHFRSYFWENVQLNAVLELSSVRREVFSQSSDPSIAPACVMFYQRKRMGDIDNGHLVKHTSVKPSVFFSLFKVLTVEKADIQYVRQELLSQYDYLWKILLYGSYLDFLFVKRLKEKKTIKEKLNEHGFECGLGVTCGKEGNRHYNISDYVGKKKIEADQLHQYVVSPTDERWELASAQWGRRKQLFEAPLLLIRKSLDASDFSCRAAVCTEDAVYKDAITGVHGDSIEVLRNIAGTLNSRFFTYYAMMCFSSLGIEREQGHNMEKFSLPYMSGDIHKIVERIEKKYSRLEEGSLQNPDVFARQIEREKDQIEDSIASQLGLSQVEQLLIDYANNYSIPIATGNVDTKPVKNDRTGKKLMEAYACVFLNRFEGQFGEGMYLNCSCEIGSSHVLMRFNLAKEKKAFDCKQGSYSTLEAFLLALSTERVTDQLYLRKDIRGFEKNGFYIIKPCEQRLWHPAMAYVDVQEFVDALLTKTER